MLYSHKKGSSAWKLRKSRLICIIFKIPTGCHRRLFTVSIFYIARNFAVFETTVFMLNLWRERLLSVLFYLSCMFFSYDNYVICIIFSWYGWLHQGSLMIMICYILLFYSVFCYCSTMWKAVSKTATAVLGSHSVSQLPRLMLRRAGTIWKLCRSCSFPASHLGP